jgi:hypothetical protein
LHCLAWLCNFAGMLMNTGFAGDLALRSFAWFSAENHADRRKRP